MAEAQIVAVAVHLQELLEDDVLPINEADDEEEALAALVLETERTPVTRRIKGYFENVESAETTHRFQPSQNSSKLKTVFYRYIILLYIYYNIYYIFLYIIYYTFLYFIYIIYITLYNIYKYRNQATILPIKLKVLLSLVVPSSVKISSSTPGLPA